MSKYFWLVEERSLWGFVCLFQRFVILVSRKPYELRSLNMVIGVEEIVCGGANEAEAIIIVRLNVFVNLFDEGKN